jgi:hypothetical protein
VRYAHPDSHRSSYGDLNRDSHGSSYGDLNRDGDANHCGNADGNSYGNNHTNGDTYRHDVSLPRLRNEHGHRRDRSRYNRYR